MNNQMKTSWRHRIAAVAVLLGACLAPAVQAQPAVEAVSGSIQGGSEVVRIDFSQPLQAVPAGFTIQAPARIALDVPGATNALGRSSVEVNLGNLRSVNVVQAGERTRGPAGGGCGHRTRRNVPAVPQGRSVSAEGLHRRPLR